MPGAADGDGDGGDWIADGGIAAEGDAIGAEGVGGALVFLDCRNIGPFRKELTDDIALSTLSRITAAVSKDPETWWPRPITPRKV